MSALAPEAEQAGAAEISAVVRAPAAVVYTGQEAADHAGASVEPAISGEKALELLKKAFPELDRGGEQDISM